MVLMTFIRCSNILTHCLRVLANVSTFGPVLWVRWFTKDNLGTQLLRKTQSQGPPVPDSFHLGKSGNPDREGGGDSESGIKELKVFEDSFCLIQLDQINNQLWPSVSNFTRGLS